MSSYHIDIKNVLNPEILGDNTLIEKFLRKLCKFLDLKIIQMFGREFHIDKGSMKGSIAYTYCCVLGTSSLTYHTYPEANACQLDIVSCVSLENKYMDLLGVMFQFIKTENQGVVDYTIKHLKRENFLIRYE